MSFFIRELHNHSKYSITTIINKYILISLTYKFFYIWISLHWLIRLIIKPSNMQIYKIFLIGRITI